MHHREIVFVHPQVLCPKVLKVFLSNLVYSIYYGKEGASSSVIDADHYVIITVTRPYFERFFFICIVGGGIKVHSTLRPLNGLLYQPRVIIIMEKSVE
jgi:hypothetical protein